MPSLTYHPELEIPMEIYSHDLTSTGVHVPVIYNAMIKLYDELTKLKAELDECK